MKVSEKHIKIGFYVSLLMGIIVFVLISWWMKSPPLVMDEEQHTKSFVYYNEDPVDIVERLKEIYSEVEEKGVSVCEILADENMKEYCYSHYYTEMSLRIGDASYCLKIPSNDSRIGCVVLLSYYLNKSLCTILENERYICEVILKDIYNKSKVEEHV